MAGPGLAERLGHGPEDRLLIVNCDDLGSSRAAKLAVSGFGVNRGVIVVPAAGGRS